ncbi:hypothetical protein C0214_10895 [Methylobacterium sp. DM1]|nr:hypothetical protein C0214_10895 [Methylobacterium sp. DM1]MBI1691942.1 hypothetical protein [Methylorubrum sp. DB1722]
MDQALLRRQARHRPLGLQRAGRDEPVGDVVPAVRAEGLLDGPGVLAPDRRGAELILDDAADLLAPGEVVGEVDDLPARPHEAVDAVLVAPVFLVVLDAAVRLRRQAELALEQGPPPRPGPGVVDDEVLGVDVEVVDRPVRAAAE